MVWTTEQSPLYRSVAAHNETAGQPESPPPEARTAETPCPPPPPKPSCSAGCRPHSPGVSGGLLQRLTGDPDQLLIIALILLLLHEKADMKLVAALAFVLLS